MAIPGLQHHNIHYRVPSTHQGRGSISCLKPGTQLHHCHDSDTLCQHKLTQRACEHQHSTMPN